MQHELGPNELGPIASAILIMKELEKDRDFIDDDWPLHKFPFGIWFRGHSEQIKEIKPRVFREKENEDKQRVAFPHYDETNLFEHCKLRVPHYQQTYRSAFDWLCLLQHYSVPTRLLDWSESILPALYFAVDKPDRNGELVVLNARRLNKIQMELPSICTANNPRVIVRSETSATRSARELMKQRSICRAARKLGIKLTDSWMEQFRTPIGVFPNRLNDRMIFQASVFTLHGGKMYHEEIKNRYENDMIPEPISLEEIDKKVQILKRYMIPKEWKIQLREELFRLGIHEGTLFPEIDHQAIYLKQLW